MKIKNLIIFRNILYICKYYKTFLGFSYNYIMPYCRIIYSLILFHLFFCHSQKMNAQLNANDSILFNQIFTSTKYVNDSTYSGHWYLYDSIHSVSDYQNIIDSIFKYSLSDFQQLSTMNVSSQFVFDTIVNPTYNNYPNVYMQKNPMVYFDFSLNSKNSTTYSFYYPRDTNQLAKTAFFIIPGNGENSVSKVVQGIDYYNYLCFVSQNLKNYGDVFVYMKPNEDARAIYWNNKKINNQSLVDQLDTVNTPYGLHYLIEMIATIKSLKKQYCKVMILGISEGGYAALLSSLITKPDASIISAGYSVGFDNSPISLPILYSRFDSLVYFYQKDSIKNLIQSQNTKYLFTYGDLDVVNLMQEEHDSNLTQQYFNDTLNTSFYYNYQNHTFPYCSVINDFFNPILTKSVISFYNTDTSRTDTLFAMVQNCIDSCYNFDLYLNGNLFQSYQHICGDTLLTLVDSGFYYINSTAICYDSIYWHLNNQFPNLLVETNFPSFITYNNPIYSDLFINNKRNKPYSLTVFDIYGKAIIHKQIDNSSVQMDFGFLHPGLYFLRFKIDEETFTGKLLKK